MRIQLPDNVSKYNETPEFDETTTVPAKLTRAHRTKASTWGMLTISADALEYAIPGPPMQFHLVSDGESAIIEPSVENFVRCPEKVSFRIEFYRETRPRIRKGRPEGRPSHHRYRVEPRGRPG